MSNLCFAQVREDPMIEINLVNQSQETNLKVCCVSSGGCTLLSLISVCPNKIALIDCVDVNEEQNYLVELKIAICKYFKTQSDLLKFLQGEFTSHEYDKIMMELDLSSNGQQYWIRNLKNIYLGFNQQGKFEHLFRDLVQSQFNYEQHFNRDYLARIFGHNAIDTSRQKEFSDHFKHVIDTLRQNYQPHNNYFYHQILYNKYNSDCVPPYINNFKQVGENEHKLHLIAADYIDHIKGALDESYDIIHTSNLTDWMSSNHLDDFIEQLYRVLKPHGSIIMRRLNGDYKLNEKLRKYFKCKYVVDRSHFYSEVVVAQRE